MALLTRKTQQVFASSATNVGQFGSGQLGTKVITTDPAVIQGLSAFTGGWSSSVMGSNKFPPIEEMNAMDLLATYQLAYLFQEGIPEYDSGTTYSQFAIVKNPGTFQLYGSIVTNNVGNALNDGAAWQFLFDMSSITSNLYTAGITTGTANAQALAAVTPLAGFSLRNGVTVTATAGLTNTAAVVTMNIAGTGIINVQKEVGGVLVNLANGDLTNGQLFTVQFNSTAGVWVLTGVVPANYLQIANLLSEIAALGSGAQATACANIGALNTLIVSSYAVGSYAKLCKNTGAPLSTIFVPGTAYSASTIQAQTQANYNTFGPTTGTWMCVDAYLQTYGGWGGTNSLSVWNFQRIA